MRKGRNARERRAGLETGDAEAAPPEKWGGLLSACGANVFSINVYATTGSHLPALSEGHVL